MPTKTINFDSQPLAILVQAKDIEQGSTWIGESHESLQAQSMKFPKGKRFKPHYHILNPRTIKRTQEAFIVIRGEILVNVYFDSKYIDSLLAGPGDAIFLYRGGHSVEFLEDSLVYEVKAGQFTFPSEDKIYDSSICTTIRKERSKVFKTGC